VQIGEGKNANSLAQLDVIRDETVRGLLDVHTRFFVLSAASGSTTPLILMGPVGGNFRKNLVWPVNSTGAPRCFNDSEEASRIRTNSNPCWPLESGRAPWAMQSRKCWHSIFSGSSC